MLRLLAHGVVRGRWVVVLAWVILGCLAATRAYRVQEALDVRGGSEQLTEAKRAENLLRDRFPRPIRDFYAITLQGPGRFDTAGPPRLVLDSLIAALRAERWVRGVVGFPGTGDSTFLGPDRTSTFLVVALEIANNDSAGVLVKPARALVKRTLAAFPDGDRYVSKVTGRGPLDSDVRAISAEDSRDSELKLFPLTLAILLLAFGALVAALLPLLVGFLAIIISLAAIEQLAHVYPMSIFVLNMTTMIGLGVGIDYSLLVVTRFREELGRGLRRLDAARETVRTAGAAVVTSGITVFIGFSALLFTPLLETKSVGIGGLIVVAVAVLLSVTLLPAVLAIAGRAIDRPRWLASRLAWYHAPQVWERWARTLSRHPWRALGIGLAIVALLTWPLLRIEIGLPSRHWWPSYTEAGQGVEQLQRMGVAGYIQPVRIVVEMPAGERATSATALRGLRSLSDSLRADPRVREVKSLVDVDGRRSLLELSALYSDADSARLRYPDLLDAYLSADGRATLVDVIPTDTTSLTSIMQLVRDVRTRLADQRPKQLKAASIGVGGYVAQSVDLQEELLGTFPMLVLLILGATAVMLAIAFRSVLIPIKAVILNTFSVAATFGLIVLVFQDGLGGRLFGLDGPTDAIFVVVPVLVFAVVFGLSMDYEVFLLARIKEAYDRTGRNDEATMEGVSATASVITSAALIMLLVFGAFAFARILLVQFLGFGLAVAVFLDATVIRMVLVPAFMQLMGKWNWWPGERRRGA
ncbi:MAG: MMPL family transporter [Gemmatimonadales bacterium]|nr:MMPL family transporter [Gemmatimonadales bacterium]